MFHYFHFDGPLSANLNLAAQVALAAAMTVGAICARRKHYRAHGIIEASVVLLNLALIGAYMLPSFPRHIWRKSPAVLTRPYLAIVIIHAVLGAAAELLGLYVVLSAATKLLPGRFRIQNYKLWMRITFVFWWLALVAGGALYYYWYVALPH
jgi:uncharacterized membrane protein YozB (DUF420 family)